MNFRPSFQQDGSEKGIRATNMAGRRDVQWILPWQNYHGESYLDRHERDYRLCHGGRLRNQARLQRFKDVIDLIEAFESITLMNNAKSKRNDAAQPKVKKNKNGSERTRARQSSAPRNQVLQLQWEVTECVKLRTAASKPTDTRPDESAGETSKWGESPFVGSEPYLYIHCTYTVSVIYTARDNIQPFKRR